MSSLLNRSYTNNSNQSTRPYILSSPTSTQQIPAREQEQGRGRNMDLRFDFPPPLLILLYVVDWIVSYHHHRSIIAAAGGVLNFVTPYKRPFSVLSLENSYPYFEESITTSILVVVSLIGPAAIVSLVALIFVPGYRFNRQLSRAQIIRLKLWELEKGLAGLALACATSLFITQGLKNLFGKSMPNTLDRCDPDFANLASYVIGAGLGQTFDPRWTLVAASICKNTDIKTLNDAFRSFPSGHSSFSFAGLLYLSLFLCSKFGIWIPHLPYQTLRNPVVRGNDQEMLPFHAGPSTTTQNDKPPPTSRDLRHQAASPPNYLIIVAFFPIAVALYISATRFFEFYHFGFDIIVGILIGIICAWVSFRWYHLPLARGDGWAWGPRSAERAFGIGVGLGNYAKERDSIG